MQAYNVNNPVNIHKKFHNNPRKTKQGMYTEKMSCHCIVQYMLKWQENYKFCFVKKLTRFWQGICQISVKNLSKSSQFLVRNLSKSSQFLVGRLSRMFVKEVCPKVVRFLSGVSQKVVRFLSINRSSHK